MMASQFRAPESVISKVIRVKTKESAAAEARMHARAYVQAQQKSASDVMAGARLNVTAPVPMSPGSALRRGHSDSSRGSMTLSSTNVSGNSRRVYRRSSLAAVAAEAIKTAKKASTIARSVAYQEASGNPEEFIAEQRRMCEAGLKTMLIRKNRIENRLKTITDRHQTTANSAEWKHRLPRRKSPWDYVLEEVVWMSKDFFEERKWKLKMAQQTAYRARKFVVEDRRRKIACELAMQKYHREAARVVARAVRLYWFRVATEAGLDWKSRCIISKTQSSLASSRLRKSVKCGRLVSTSLPESGKISSQILVLADDEKSIDKAEARSMHKLGGKNALKEAWAEELQGLKTDSCKPLKKVLGATMLAKMTDSKNIEKDNALPKDDSGSDFMEVDSEGGDEDSGDELGYEYTDGISVFVDEDDLVQNIKGGEKMYLDTDTDEDETFTVTGNEEDDDEEEEDEDEDEEEEEGEDEDEDEGEEEAEEENGEGVESDSLSNRNKPRESRRKNLDGKLGLLHSLLRNGSLPVETVLSRMIGDDSSIDEYLEEVGHTVHKGGEHDSDEGPGLSALLGPLDSKSEEAKYSYIKALIRLLITGAAHCKVELTNAGRLKKGSGERKTINEDDASTSVFSLSKRDDVCQWLEAMKWRDIPAVVFGSSVVSRAAIISFLLSRCTDSPSADWGPHLVIVPPSAVEAFVLTIKQYCPLLEVFSIHGHDHIQAKRAAHVAQMTPTNLKTRFTDSDYLGESAQILSTTFNVCVASYEGVLAHKSSLWRQRWSCLIFEQPEYVQGWSSSPLESGLSGKVSKIMQTCSARYRIVLSSLENASNRVFSMSNKHNSSASDNLAFTDIIMMLLPGAFSSLEEIEKWCQFSSVKGRHENGFQLLLEFLQAVSVYATEMSKPLCDAATFKLCGCRAPASQMLWYTRATQEIGKKLILSNEEYVNATNEMRDIEKLEVEASITLEELARFICTLHSAAMHTRLGSCFRRNRTAKSSGEPLRSLVALPQTPAWAWSILEKSWMQHVNFDVLNLCIADLALSCVENTYSDYSLEAAVPEASANSMTIRALRECKFHLACVTASVDERDDGGPLAEFSQIMHAKKMSSVEQLSEHQVYLNRIRCQRVSIYGGRFRMLKKLCNGVRSSCRIKKLFESRQSAFRAWKPIKMGGLSSLCSPLFFSSPRHSTTHETTSWHVPWTYIDAITTKIANATFDVGHDLERFLSFSIQKTIVNSRPWLSMHLSALNEACIANSNLCTLLLQSCESRAGLNYNEQDSLAAAALLPCSAGRFYSVDAAHHDCANSGKFRELLGLLRFQSTCDGIMPSADISNQKKRMRKGLPPGSEARTVVVVSNFDASLLLQGLLASAGISYICLDVDSVGVPIRRNSKDKNSSSSRHKKKGKNGNTERIADDEHSLIGESGKLQFRIDPLLTIEKRYRNIFRFNMDTSLRVAVVVQSSLRFLLHASPLLHVDQLIFFDALTSGSTASEISHRFIQAVASSPRDPKVCRRSKLKVCRMYLKNTFEEELLEKLHISDKIQRLVCKGVSFSTSDLETLSSHVSNKMQPLHLIAVDPTKSIQKSTKGKQKGGLKKNRTTVPNDLDKNTLTDYNRLVSIRVQALSYDISISSKNGKDTQDSVLEELLEQQFASILLKDNTTDAHEIGNRILPLHPCELTHVEMQQFLSYTVEDQGQMTDTESTAEAYQSSQIVLKGSINSHMRSPIASWVRRALYSMDPDVLFQLMVVYAQDAKLLDNDATLRNRTTEKQWRQNAQVKGTMQSFDTAEIEPSFSLLRLPHLPSDEELIHEAAKIFNDLNADNESGPKKRKRPPSGKYLHRESKRLRTVESIPGTIVDSDENVERTFPGTSPEQTNYMIDAFSGLKESLTLHVGLQSHWRFGTNRNLPPGVHREDPRSYAFRQLKNKLQLSGDEVYAPPSVQPGFSLEKRRVPEIEVSDRSGGKVAVQFYHNAAKPPGEISSLLESDTTSRLPLQGTKSNNSTSILTGQKKMAATSSSNVINSQKPDGNRSSRKTPGVAFASTTLGSTESDWTLWEDTILKKAQRKFGSNWDLLADMLNSAPQFDGRVRSASQCKDRYESIMKMSISRYDRSNSSLQVESSVLQYPWARGCTRVGDILWNGIAEYGGASASSSPSMDRIDKEAIPALNSTQMQQAFGKIVRTMNCKAGGALANRGQEVPTSGESSTSNNSTSFSDPDTAGHGDKSSLVKKDAELKADYTSTSSSTGSAVRALNSDEQNTFTSGIPKSSEMKPKGGFDDARKSFGVHKSQSQLVTRIGQNFMNSMQVDAAKAMANRKHNSAVAQPAENKDESPEHLLCKFPNPMWIMHSKKSLQRKNKETSKKSKIIDPFNDSSGATFPFKQFSAYRQGGSSIEVRKFMENANQIVKEAAKRANLNETAMSNIWKTVSVSLFALVCCVIFII